MRTCFMEGGRTVIISGERTHQRFCEFFHSVEALVEFRLLEKTSCFRRWRRIFDAKECVYQVLNLFFQLTEAHQE